MMEQKSFMSIAREGGSMATGYLIYNAIEKGELDEDLAKLGYRKVRRAKVVSCEGGRLIAVWSEPEHDEFDENATGNLREFKSLDTIFIEDK